MTLATEMDTAEVEARFSWARRRGTPYWIWPEVSPESWTAALGQIDRCIRHILAGNPGSAAIDGDADALGIAAFTSGMGPLLGYWSGAGLLDVTPALQTVFERHLAHNIERMDRLRSQAVAAVTALTRAGVTVTVLKGLHTAYDFFPIPGSRPCSDIDLLVDKSAEETANVTLSSLGYRAEAASPGERTWRMPGTALQPPSLSLVHRDGPWSIDLHTSLDRRYSPGSQVIRLDRALQACDRAAWPLSPKGKVLTGAHLVLYLAAHASLNLTSLSMLRLTELVLVIRRLEEARCLSWDEVLIGTARTGNPGNGYPALHFANVLAPGTVPEWVLRALERHTPATVRKVLAPLTPASCQRILRYSLAERFMWIQSFPDAVREAIGICLPSGGLGQLMSVYRYRFRLLLGGRITF